MNQWDHSSSFLFFSKIYLGNLITALLESSLQTVEEMSQKDFAKNTQLAKILISWIFSFKLYLKKIRTYF